MTDLQPYTPPALPVLPEHESWMRVYQPMIDLAARLATSPFVPDKMRGNPADTFSVLLAGHGLGLSPVQSLQSIVLISGKPYISTEVILGLALRAGHQVQWVESTDKRATVRVTRGDGHGSAEVTYTIAQAQAAGLTGKDNWRKMPAEMLRARAVRAALKMVAPDIALGLETAENPATAVAEAPPAATTVVQVGRSPQESEGTLEIAPDSGRNTAEPSHAPDIEPPPAHTITPAQMRLLQKLIGDYETAEQRKLTRTERRDLIAGLAEIEELASAKDLTADQARLAIDKLQDILTAIADIPQAEAPQ